MGSSIPLSKITVPITTISVCFGIIAAAVYKYDEIDDRITSIEEKAKIHVQIDHLVPEIKRFWGVYP
jgi:hypothetical protein